MPVLLVVDDEPNVRFSLEEILRTDSLDVVSAATAREGVAQVKQARPDVVLLDVRLPDGSGLEAFDQMRAIDSRLPIIFMTAFAGADVAIEAMKRGAFDYLLKPLDLPELRTVVGKALELSRLSRTPTVLAGAATGDAAPADSLGDHIVGASSAMQRVYKAIGRVAGQDVNVLILGESGTGKELVARAIYQHGRRSAQPFLALNCAAIPETLLESELFGHERGSFTGADRRRIGKFEQADDGTLFLDEIGDMAPGTQAKMLRVLQEQAFERVGGNETIHTNVRVVAATNQNLESLVASGKFRQDLFYRLNGFTIKLPPLRERMEDLPALVEYFIQRSNEELSKHVRSTTDDALAALKNHSWPGNVRELQGAVRYAVVQSTGDFLRADDLPASIAAPRSAIAASPPMATTPSDSLNVAALVRRLLEEESPDLYERVLAAVDRVVLEEVLRAVQGNQVAASEKLGMARNTLRSKLKALGLTVEKHLGPAPAESPAAPAVGDE